MSITSRSDLIAYMEDRLGILATEAGWTADSYYEKPLDVALLSISGATTYPPDVTYTVTGVLDVFEQACLKKLRNYYSFYVDTEVGPRKQKFSQLLASIEKRILEAPISVDNTFDLGDFNPSGTIVELNGFELTEFDYNG